MTKKNKKKTFSGHFIAADWSTINDMRQWRSWMKHTEWTYVWHSRLQSFDPRAVPTVFVLRHLSICFVVFRSVHQVLSGGNKSITFSTTVVIKNRFLRAKLWALRMTDRRLGFFAGLSDKKIHHARFSSQYILIFSHLLLNEIYFKWNHEHEEG